MFFLYASLIGGCSGSAGAPAPAANPIRVADSSAGSKKQQVLATTGMIADAAKIVGGDRAEVVALMGPGVDPHLYQPTARDQSKLKSAEIVFYNGLHLEGKMVEIFESLAKSRPGKIVAVSRDLRDEQLLAWEDSAGQHDPHIWFDVRLWQQVIRTIEQTYSDADPANAEGYHNRAAAYLKELDELHDYCLKHAEELPKEQRLLITSHDAFHYFGRAYGFDVVGIQGISTETEAGLKAITDAVDLIRSRHLKAIFPESSVPRAAIERVAQDSGAKLGEELYSDALGAPDSTAGTYLGMIRTNFDHIVNGLKGSP
jgi:manganese/zinc/iron transport system substrate-binding protein